MSDTLSSMKLSQIYDPSNLFICISPRWLTKHHQRITKCVTDGLLSNISPKFVNDLLESGEDHLSDLVAGVDFQPVSIQQYYSRLGSCLVGGVFTKTKQPIPKRLVIIRDIFESDLVAEFTADDRDDEKLLLRGVVSQVVGVFSDLPTVEFTMGDQLFVVVDFTSLPEKELRTLKPIPSFGLAKEDFDVYVK